MATTFFDPAAGWKAYVLQARTDTSGAAVDDAGGEDLRTVLDAFYTEGIVTPAAAFQVTEDSPTGMTVLIGSGTAKADHALIDGDISGQGAYLARMEDATVTLTVPAADGSNPRIDEVYLVVQDNAFDSSGNVVPRIAYRDGTAGTSPSPPGPDAAWEAYMLVATINVAAGATEITNSDITDNRVYSSLSLGGSDRVSVESAADTSTTVRSPTSVIRWRTSDGLAFSVGTTQFFFEGRDIDSVGTVDGVDVSAHTHDGTADDGGTVSHDNLSGVSIDDHHARDHAARHLEDGADPLGWPGNFEVDGSTTVDSVSLTDTMANVASVTLSIPATWGSWKCFAYASYEYQRSFGSYHYHTTVRIDGTDGAEKDIQVVIGNEDDAITSDGSNGAHRTGMTTTGNRTISLRARESSGVGSIQRMFLYARAVRTS